MKSLLDTIMERNEVLIKEAFVGALMGAAARGGMNMLARAGTWAVKNPLKALNVGLPAYEGASAAKGAFKAQRAPVQAPMSTGPTM